ncbi:hypothetical protein B0H17DRAFT_835794, partial [Mycena rosella]
CLRANHGVQTIEQGLPLLQWFRNPAHKPRANCKCIPCEEDRRHRGCNNPHSCVKAVKMRLSQLQPKWDPRNMPLGSAREENDPPQGPEAATRFQPPKQITKLSEGLRIFTAREPTGPVDP